MLNFMMILRHGTAWSSVDSPHKECVALMFSMLLAPISCWKNIGFTGDSRRQLSDQWFCLIIYLTNNLRSGLCTKCNKCKLIAFITAKYWLCSISEVPVKSPRHWVHNNKHRHIIYEIVVPEAHYNDVIMSAMASQITSGSVVYSNICSGADQRKRQSSASLAFARWIQRWPCEFPAQRAINAENISIWWHHHVEWHM